MSRNRTSYLTLCRYRSSLSTGPKGQSYSLRSLRHGQSDNRTPQPFRSEDPPLPVSQYGSLRNKSCRQRTSRYQSPLCMDIPHVRLSIRKLRPRRGMHPLRRKVDTPFNQPNTMDSMLHRPSAKSNCLQISSMASGVS